MRSGNDYLASLKDGREIYIEGERVSDVVSHPAFSPIAHTIAELYDLAVDPANAMTYHAPETGAESNLVYSIPRSIADLAARRHAIEIWARHTHGWVGRSPDHVGSFLAAFAAHPEIFISESRNFSSNVVNYHKRVLGESLFVSYAIIPPQASRTAAIDGWDGELIQTAVVEEKVEGIVVRGAQMLATASPVADEIFISCIKPLTAEDRDFALGFVIPVATDGLKLYCRRPYAPAASSHYDYPLSTRFDETDALVVFDDVLIPWDSVFVYRDVAGVRSQFFETGAHVLGNWQAQIRLVVKLQFIAGVAGKVAEVNGIDKIPSVQDRLGELASIASLVESAVLAAEYKATPDNNGMWRPNSRALYGAMGLQAELYPRVLSILRELVGGGVLQLPSSEADLANPVMRRDIDRYFQSPGINALERIKLFKLAWDIVGSEFAGRHQQYEMFYAGAPFISKGYAYRNYGYNQPIADVETFLASYHIEGNST